MRKLILPTAAVLALAVPAAAQEAGAPEGATEVIVEEVVTAAPEAAPAPAMRFVPSEVVQATPPPAVPANGEYPPCKGEQKDNCVNPREAGLNYGNRALEYWPGKPASEIDTPLPAEKPGS